jgi:glycerophosphoryl diester phosphodiesterase
VVTGGRQALVSVRPVVSSRFFGDAGPLAFAHRGGAAEAPENSWGAFERAAGLGFRYMETDVRATFDGVAVAIHDPTVERVTGEAGLVKTMDWPRLQALRLRDGQGIPRLEDLLAAWPELRWNIDVKEDEAVAPLVSAIKHTSAQDRVLIASFSGRRTARVRAAIGPALATSAGRATVALLLATKFVPFAGGRIVGSRTEACRTVPGRRRVEAAQVPVAQKGVRIVDDRFVHACHKMGVAVHVWTINDGAEMNRLLDMGVDGIMTDRPTLLKQVLGERGQWPQDG